jgi:muramidase (phage lysozyme)
LLGWQGVPISRLGAQYFNEVSTAAGAYQIIKPTWVTLALRLRLPDFEPASQDAAAVELIREAGALSLINSGQFVEAILKCRNIWASLPGSTSGQPQTVMSSLVTLYTAAGGAFA